MGNFDCIGFQADSAEDISSLVERILPMSSLMGMGPRGSETYRWEDKSGARIVIEKRGKIIHNVLPSFAGDPGATLTNVVRLNDDTSRADVVDDAGEQLTALAVDLEQRAVIARQVARGRASLTAFVGEATFHADAQAFSQSPVSLMLDPADAVGSPPAHFLEQGWPWPPRMGPQSFVSQGLFSSPADARPIAVLNGLVRGVDLRTNAITGRSFLRIRLETIGFTVDACMPAGDQAEVPQAGQVMAGTVYMVGSLEDWTAEDADPPATGFLGRLRSFGRGGDG